MGQDSLGPVARAQARSQGQFLCRLSGADCSWGWFHWYLC